MIKRILAIIFVGLLHLMVTVLAFGKAEVIDAPDMTWGVVTYVMSFPVMWLLFLERYIYLPRIFGMDWFPILMVLNSLFWGAVIVAFVFWVKKPA